MSAGSRTNDPPPPDAWRPGCSLATLRARARLLADIRACLTSRGLLEVETPLACRAAGTDPAIEPLRTRFTGPGHADGVDLYLQTSPEFAMKRLLAAGSGPIFQVCKAFRDGEAGRWHNPEFTLLEWYRPGGDLDGLMDEVAAVVRVALARPDLAVERISYVDLFADGLGVDALAATADDLAAEACRHDLVGVRTPDLGRDAWLDLLLSHLLQPGLGAGSLCFLTDYPASQAALARLNPDGLTARRFELFHRGVELANGFDELTDPDEQAGRFAADNATRRRDGQPALPVDSRLLAALRDGLPGCVGVAMGLDRLLMLQLGLDDIDAALAFALPRC
jgi:elongation factor P--(R)-beta-lysine ligase